MGKLALGKINEDVKYQLPTFFLLIKDSYINEK